MLTTNVVVRVVDEQSVCHRQMTLQFVVYGHQKQCVCSCTSTVACTLAAEFDAGVYMQGACDTNSQAECNVEYAGSSVEQDA